MGERRPLVWLHRFSPTARISIAMALGGLTGVALGPKVDGIGEAGKALIGLIKMLATPLILFAVLDAFLRSTMKARSGLAVIAISAVNAALALIIGLTLANTLQPGRFLAVPADATDPPRTTPNESTIHSLDDPTGILPTNLVDPFRTNAIAAVALFAVLAGAALRRYKDEQVAVGSRDYLAIEGFVTGSLRTIELMLGWIVALLPVAVFAVMAQTVGTQGLAALRGLAAYVGVVVLGLAIHVGFVYQAWVVFVARMPLGDFWSELRAPLACAFGSSSSLATLPVTLRSLRAMKVSDSSARMSACVATNLNNDGILLYEAMAALMVAQAFGVSLNFGEQLMVAATCILATLGIAGVPEAGMISLSVVLASAKLPVDLLPLLLSVDWVLGRCRAMTNVVSDVLGAVLLDRFAGPIGPTADSEPAKPLDEPSALTAIA
jgi:Na+/H+-dicarboxylate symporter